MATTIILYNQLSNADINGTWSFVGTQVSYPAPPVTYNGSINFNTYNPGDYTYRYTKTTNNVTHTSDVTITWRGSSPPRQNDTCSTAFIIPVTPDKLYSVVVEDDNRNTCPDAKAPSIPSPSDYPSTWNQGVYTGDLWYMVTVPAKPYTYGFEVEISSVPYVDELAATGLAIQVFKNTTSQNCANDVSVLSAASQPNSKTCKVLVNIQANAGQLMRFRVASVKPGFYQLTVKTSC